jgi:hypothetical protein
MQPAYENVVSTCGFLRKPPVLILLALTVFFSSLPMKMLSPHAVFFSSPLV